MFVTKGGHTGLCDPRVQAGDEVWVLEGGRVPFILRPLAQPSLYPSQYRNFLGDSFLYGFMDGEALDRDDYKSQEVVLV